MKTKTTMTKISIRRRVPKLAGTAGMLSWEMLRAGATPEEVAAAVAKAFPGYRQGLDGAKHYDWLFRAAQHHGLED